MKAIFKLLNPDNTMSVNRQLAHAIGLEAAVAYSALLSKYAYYEQRGLLTADGWFYSTIEDMEESTALTAKQQRRCINSLAEIGLIFTKVQGMPARRFFRINDDVDLLSEVLSKGGKSSLSKRAQLDEDKSQGAVSKNGSAEPINQNACDSPVCPKGHNWFVPKVTTSCAKTEQPVLPKRTNCTLYKTKVNNPKINQSIIDPATIKLRDPPEYEDMLAKVKEQICSVDIGKKYGVEFAALCDKTVASGLMGMLCCKIDGKLVSGAEISEAYKKLDYPTVCRVADYIAEKENIRHLSAYLTILLYTAGLEKAQKPASQSSIDISVLEELRQQYSNNG